MSAVMTSLPLEFRRLTRTGLLTALLAAFAFFGLAGPGLAVAMPDLLRAAGTEQLTINAAAATPQDGIALYTQSAMQLGLILAAATAITALGWDTRNGTAIFYRTRATRLASLTLPRFLVDVLAAVGAYTLGLALAAALTALVIGPVPVDLMTSTWGPGAVYLIFAMSMAHLVMTMLRRTATAIAVTTVILLVLPLASQIDILAAWSPTSLITGHLIHPGPVFSAIVIAGVFHVCAAYLAPLQRLRRDG